MSESEFEGFYRVSFRVDGLVVRSTEKMPLVSAIYKALNLTTNHSLVVISQERVQPIRQLRCPTCTHQHDADEFEEHVRYVPMQSDCTEPAVVPPESQEESRYWSPPRCNRPVDVRCNTAYAHECKWANMPDQMGPCQCPCHKQENWR